MHRPTIVGIAGGTASGKTSIARKVREAIGTEHSTLIELDAYYRDLSDLDFEERARVNFDHPQAFDFELLIAHIRMLQAGDGIEMPVTTTSATTVAPKRFPRRRSR
jgi:uridine kinase